MTLSKSGEQLRKAITRAIEDQIITPEEYEEIIHISYEDGHLDDQEKALLSQLQAMIENKEVQFGNKKE